MEIQERIISTAESLYFNSGLKSISLDDVCRPLKISKKTLYKYFGKKEDLVRSSFLGFFNRIESEIAQLAERYKNPVEQLWHASDLAISKLSEINPTFIKELKQYHQNIYVEIVMIRENFVRKMVKQNIRSGIEQGYFRNEIPIDFISEVFSNEILQITQKMASRETQFEPPLIKALVEYHVRGIASNKGYEAILHYFKNNKHND